MAGKLWVGGLPAGALVVWEAGEGSGAAQGTVTTLIGACAGLHRSRTLAAAERRPCSVCRVAAAAARRQGTPTSRRGTHRRQRRQPATTRTPSPPTGIPDGEVYSAFSKFGQLRSCWVARKPPGFGFGEHSSTHVAASRVLPPLLPGVGGG